MDEDVKCRLEKAEKAIDVLFERTNETKQWQSKYGEKIENIQNNVETLTKSIAEMLSKPQKRWDTVVSSAIAALVGGGIGVLVTTIINGIRV